MPAAARGSDSLHARPSVLVTDVQALGMLGVCRSLGRAGYVTHGCSSDPRALGLRSRFNRQPTVAPRYDSDAYLPWLRDYVKGHGIEVIVPTEAFLLAIRPCYAEFRPLLPLGVDEESLYACLSKCDVLASFSGAPGSSPLRRHLPPFVLVSAQDGLAAAATFEPLGTPLWVKADAVHDRSTRAASAVRRSATAADAAAQARQLLATHDRVLVQANAPAARQAGVNLLVDGDAILAESMMLSLHDNPHTGGTSGLRRTWWHQAMRDDALARVRHLGWRGAAMLEYRWDPTSDEFYFIEINSRFWAGLHLDLMAGVDYPRLLLERHLGTSANSTMHARLGVTTRWTLPTDWGHMLSRARDGRLDWLTRASAPLEFLARFLQPGVRDDLRFPGDASLYWRQWGRFARDLLRGGR